MQINRTTGAVFKKSGREFISVLSTKINGLRSRLAKRNRVLEEVMIDKRRLRSYLLRSAKPVNQAHNVGRYGVKNSIAYGKEHIGIEEVEEIKNLCARIFQIENEIQTLETLKNNLKDEDVVSLSLQELLQYGFE